MTHSPGPWRSFYPLSVGGSTFETRDKDGLLVAHLDLFDSPLTVDCARANFALVTAAPDLLLVLEQAFAFLNLHYCASGLPDLSKLLAGAQTAIAKAKGAST